MNINEASAQEEAEKEQEELESYLSIPPGGPVYTPNSIGPITRVPEFEASMILELQNLKAELYCDSSLEAEDDIL